MKALLALYAVLSCTISPLAFEDAPPRPESGRLTGEEGGAEAASLAANDWPWWRGPTYDGKSPDRVVPTTWSQTENVAWQVAVPGRGHASPIVCGDRVFLATADEQTQKQSVMAFDRQSGKPLWTTTAHTGGFMNKHGKNSHASATPACDGERVYSAFINDGALRVTAMDIDGKTLWQSSAGEFRSEHGYGSSPVLYKSLVIVLGDSLSRCFIAALDSKTGRPVWQVDRKTTGKHGSYATPIVARVSGKPQLLVSGMESTSSLDPESGKLIWSCNGPAEVTACTPAFSDTVVFSSGGFPEKELLAIRGNGTGDVTRSHVIWRSGKGVTYVPSPLFHNGRLYVVSDNGVTTCFEAANGKQVWQGRIDGDFSSSPVLAGEFLFVTNERGKTYVLKTGPKFEVVAQNDLNDGGFASPAICGGRIYLRTDQHLYCIGQPSAAAGE
jgi:outer membrane protein assembly factor BamB